MSIKEQLKQAAQILDVDDDQIDVEGISAGESIGILWLGTRSVTVAAADIAEMARVFDDVRIEARIGHATRCDYVRLCWRMRRDP